MDSDQTARDVENPVGQPGDAAEKAFKDMRWMHRGLPQPPDFRAVLVVMLAAGALLAFVVVVMSRDTPDQPDVVMGNMSAEEVAAFPVPPDLGPAVDLGPLIDWSLVDGGPLAYEGAVTVLWFRRQLSCTGCGNADGYMTSIDERYGADGLQAVNIFDVPLSRFAREEFRLAALPDPGAAAARAFSGDDDVAANYVAVIDGAGRLRYAAPGWPDYDVHEPIIAKLMALREE